MSTIASLANPKSDGESARRVSRDAVDIGARCVRPEELNRGEAAVVTRIAQNLETKYEAHTLGMGWDELLGEF